MSKFKGKIYLLSAGFLIDFIMNYKKGGGDIIHRTFIEDKEGGTEAAAATAVIMPVAGAIPGTKPPEKLYIFNANQPFIFLIQQNQTGGIMFVGRVASP